jgi:hypothetical protein
MAEPLEMIANAFYTPERNPDATHVDDNGNITNSSGQIVPMYTKPGWFQRAVNPVAQGVNRMNAEEAAMPLQSQQQNAINLKRNLDLVGKMPTQDNPFGQNVTQLGDTPFGTVDDIMGQTQRQTAANRAWAASLTNSGLSPSNSKQQIGAESGINTGLIGNTGSAEATNENDVVTKINPLQNNILQQQFYRLKNRLPNIEDKNDQQTLNELSYQMKNVPASQALDLTQTGNNQNVADATSSMSGTIADAVKRNAVDSWFQSAYGQSPSQYMMSPYAPETTPTGVILPTGIHTGFRPEIAARMAGMNAFTNGTSGMPSFAQGLINNKTGHSILNEPTVISPPGQTNDSGYQGVRTQPLIGQTNQPSITQPPNPPHIDAAAAVKSAPHLAEAEELMKSMGLLHNEELFSGKGRDTRRITDSKEESLIKSRLPLLRKYAQNPAVRPSQRALIGNLLNNFE